MPRVLELDSRDNVLIALENLKKGETITLFPADPPKELVIEPVAAQQGQTNTFGLP